MVGPHHASHLVAFTEVYAEQGYTPIIVVANQDIGQRYVQWVNKLNLPAPSLRLTLLAPQHNNREAKNARVKDREVAANNNHNNCIEVKIKKVG